MRHTHLYAGACVLALLAPLLFAAPRTRGGGHGRAAFDGWPASFEGRALTRLPLRRLRRSPPYVALMVAGHTPATACRNSTPTRLTARPPPAR